MSVDLLIVTDALMKQQDAVHGHPDLLQYQAQFSSRSRCWFECDAKNSLAWYAMLTDCSPATLLAAAKSLLPAGTRQVWVASPYHAQMMRDSVRVLPEGELAWREQDAVRLCDILNPLLLDDQMQLVNIGAALVLACREPLDAFPEGFAAIAGHLLPDHHYEGEDGGRLNRLLSEIQMLLFQHPSIERHDNQQPDSNGIWLWGSGEWPQVSETTPIAVATRNPFLQSIVDGRGARLMISETAQLQTLLQSGARLPTSVVLAGDGYALLLKKRWFPAFGKFSWQPKSVKHESDLITLLHNVI
ncbi:MAG: threonine synthase [Mariprofundus sp.]|nr:threonine synthase [Mariprofundus sp.]